MANLEDQQVAAQFLAELQQSGQLDSFKSFLMQDSLTPSFQQSAQRPVIEAAPAAAPQAIAPIQTAALAAVPAIAAAPTSAPAVKKDRSFFRKAFDASFAAIKGGVGAGAALYGADRIREYATDEKIDRSTMEYVKTIGAGAVGSAVHNLATDGEGGGLVQGVVTGLTIEALSGSSQVTVPKATVGMIAGGLFDWTKNKVMNFFGSKDSPAASRPALGMLAPA